MAGAGGVRAFAMAEGLFAARLVTAVAWVINGDQEVLLGVGIQQVGDVESEMVVSALVFAEFFFIEPNAGVPVHGIEVEEDAASGPLGGDGEPAMVPELLCFMEPTVNA